MRVLDRVDVAPEATVLPHPALKRTPLMRDDISHDDVIKWKYFPSYWPFVRGIHRSQVNFPHKGKWSGALVFSLICRPLNKRLSKQSWGCRFETPSRSLWRHCNDQAMCVVSTENRELSWCQLWRHQKFSLWQITVPPATATTKMASRWLSIFGVDVCAIRMMTSWHTFHFTGRLCGECNFHRWILSINGH